MTTRDHEALIRAKRLVQSARPVEDELAATLHRRYDADVLAVHLAFLLTRTTPTYRCQLLHALEECQQSKEPDIRERLAEALYAAGSAPAGGE